jgi:hypothetical protein
MIEWALLNPGFKSLQPDQTGGHSGEVAPGKFLRKMAWSASGLIYDPFQQKAVD